MKIGIDARMMSSNFGIGRYVQQLVKHLLEIDSENEFVFFVRDARDLTPDPSPTRRGDFKVVEADIPWYGWEEQVKFKKIIDKEDVDLMHFPHWNVPLLYNKPFVVTIHDLTMYHYPRPEATTLGPIKFWLKDKAHRLVVRHAVKRAKKIIVTSEFTRQDVHETLKVPMEKMVVTYQAPFERNKIQDTNNFKIQPSSRAQVEGNSKFKIAGQYVLYVGAAYPHKNLQGLIKAWKIFNDKYDLDYKLVLVGKRNYFYNQLFNNRPIEQYNNVIYKDDVSDTELVSLYTNASLFVFPSLYEGFGLPPLEAMSHGVPVVSSNRSCMPEVLGEAALYFDPENYEQMADVIYRGLTDEEIRFVLKDNAIELLKTYSWEKLARETLGVYKEAAGNFLPLSGGARGGL